MKKSNYILISCLLVCSFFTLSSWNFYKPLTHSSSLLDLSLERKAKGVLISAEKYTKEKSESHFSSNLLSLGYIPIEITIQNQSPSAYVISRASTALPSATAKEVAWSFRKKSIPAAVGLQIASFFLWPFSIPSAAHSLHNYKSNKNLKKELNAKTLKEEEEIVPPYSSVKRVIYLKEKEAPESFSFSLEEADSRDLTVIPVEIKPAS